MAKTKKPGPNQKQLISFWLAIEVLERTKERAAAFGLPYQTFMRLLIDQGHLYIDEHGSLNVPVKNAEEERALRTAQKRAALKAMTPEERSQTPTPARKHKGKPKGDPKTREKLDANELAAKLGASSHFPLEGAEPLAVYQERQEALRAASPAPEQAQEPDKGLPWVLPEELERWSKEDEAAECGDVEGPHHVEPEIDEHGGPAVKLTPANGPLEPFDHNAFAEKLSNTTLNVAALSRLLQRVDTHGNIKEAESPYGRHDSGLQEPISAKDAEYFKGEPAPLKAGMVPDIVIEEHVITCTTCGRPQASDFSNWSGYCYCPEHQNAIRVRNGLEPIATEHWPVQLPIALEATLHMHTPEEALYQESNISPEQFTDYGPPSAPHPTDARTISDEETRAALEEMQAMLYGSSSVEATVSIQEQAPSEPVEKPEVRSKEVISGNDLDEILALV